MSLALTALPKLLYCFVVVCCRQGLLFYYLGSFLLSFACFFHWTRSVSHGPRSLWRLPSLSNVSDFHCCALLYYCVVALFFFYPPIVDFICPLGLITSANVLIDAFISQFVFTPKVILALLLYLHKAPCHQHKP